MNINDYQRPKSKSQFRLSTSLKERQDKEIKTSLSKEIFLSKKKTFNKSKFDFISKQQQIVKPESKEKNENKINQERPLTHKTINNQKNINSFQSENTPKFVRTTKSFNFTYQSKLFLNRGKDLKKSIKTKDDILPKLLNKDKSKNSENDTNNYENNINKAKHLFYSFRNNIKLVEKKTESKDKKSLNLSHLYITKNINI